MSTEWRLLTVQRPAGRVLALRVSVSYDQQVGDVHEHERWLVALLHPREICEMRWSRSREFLVDLRIKRLELFKRRRQWDVFPRGAVDPESLARVPHERDISASRGHEACTIGTMGSPLPRDQVSAL
jgi:hypothetical protein